MRINAVLNADGGTLRTTDLDAYCAEIVAAFADAGHDLRCHCTPGRDLSSALSASFADGDAGAVIAAGGDGTISAAAAIAWRTGKPLGVIPAGTMNLFARSLGIPLEIREAARALARHKVDNSDIATANGRPFLHQFSVGFHPHMVRLREARNYKSRLGKIAASLLAALETVRRPPQFHVEIAIDGEKMRVKLASLAISNNPYGEGHLPYADDLTTGELGIYSARPASASANAGMLADLVIGAWRANPDISEKLGKHVMLSFRRLPRRAQATIDGELVDLPASVEIRMHPGELRVLRPLQG